MGTVTISVEVNGRRRTRTIDLVIFRLDAPHILDNAERLVVVQATGTKPNDSNRGVDLLKDLLDAVEPNASSAYRPTAETSLINKKCEARSNRRSSNSPISPAERSSQLTISSGPTVALLAWQSPKTSGTPFFAATTSSTGTRR